MGSSNSSNININDEEKQKIEEAKETHSDIIQKKQIIIEEKPKIKVKIPLISGGYWIKMYNSDETLKKIASDFVRENKIEINQQNYSIEYKYKNNPINIDETPLKNLIEEDTTTIQIDQVIKKIINDNIDIIGKPFLDPFQIYCFEIKTKTFKKIKYKKQTLLKYKLNKLGNNYAYCNGNNHLFISGRTGNTPDEIIGFFWDIDLMHEIISFPIKIFPKINHSMIYIDKKVYIVGGDDVNTLIYDMDIEDKEVIFWKNLHYKRFEPSLTKCGDYLYCFDMSRKYTNTFDNILNFEKIDLYSDNAQWEVIVPNIPQNIVNTIFCQKFFGVVNCDDNIIFLGGIYDKNDNENDKSIDNLMHQENELMNLKYNINKNIIEKSNIKFNDIYFNEKCFLPVDENTYVNLPYFNKHLPKIVYFYKDKNLVDINVYHSKLHVKKRNINKSQITQLKSSFIGLNFDMPSLFSNNYSQKYMTNIGNNSPDKNFFYNPLTNRNLFVTKSQFSIENNNIIAKHNINSVNKIINEEEDIKDDKNKDNTNYNKDDNYIKNVRDVNDKKNTKIKFLKGSKENDIDNVKNKKDKNEIKDTEEPSEIKDKQETNSIQKGLEIVKEDKKENNEEDDKNSSNIEKDSKNINQFNTERISNTINRLNNYNNIPIVSKIHSNRRMLYIKEPNSLTTFHSSSFGDDNNMFNSYRVKKKIRKGYIIEPINIRKKRVKSQMKKIIATQINKTEKY